MNNSSDYSRVMFQILTVKKLREIYIDIYFYINFKYIFLLKLNDLVTDSALPIVFFSKEIYVVMCSLCTHKASSKPPNTHIPPHTHARTHTHPSAAALHALLWFGVRPGPPISLPWDQRQVEEL